MTDLAGVLAACLTCVLQLAWPGGERQQARPGERAPVEASQPAGTGVIKGAVAAQTGEPVRGAEVEVFCSEPRMLVRAVTDSEGRYSATGLAPGRYSVTVRPRVPYLGGAHGDDEPGAAVGGEVEVADGKTVEAVDVRLHRGGVISGQIVDETGEPVADLQVRLLLAATGDGERRLVHARLNQQWIHTNDLGRYRIYGLDPGDYYVSVARVTDGPEGISVLYYPGVEDPAKARAVRVEADVETGEVNLRFPDAHIPPPTAEREHQGFVTAVFRAAGHDASPEPLHAPPLSLRLEHGIVLHVLNLLALADGEGAWRVSHIGPSTQPTAMLHFRPKPPTPTTV
jgi:protocatechuate 3,4-dioxygenase beta subunit